MSADRRRVSTLAALVVCLVAAGCLGSPPSSPATGPPTAAATPTPTPTASTDCPPTLSVYPLGEEPVDTEGVVDYVDLTDEQRTTFDRARTGSVEEFAPAWYDIEVVDYEGTHYRASIAVC